mgnify:CR=1 FL=1
MPPRLRFDEGERADLHLHSHHSDGLHSPEALVRMALDAGLVAVAITDHATTAGVVPACQAGARLGLHVLPGVELNSADGDLLGLWIDVHDPDLQRFLAATRAQRTTRTRRVCERLASQGIALSWTELEALASPGAPMRSHAARLLVARGHCTDVDEAFQRWLGHGAPAWVPGRAPSLEACAQAIQRAGGLAVEAHPMFHVARYGLDPDQRCAQLAALGVCGLELLPPPQRRLAPTAEALAQAAGRQGLLALGGSNFHGRGQTRARLGEPTVGGPTLARLQAMLPAHSCHRGAFGRATWRAQRLSPDELERSFEPETVVLDRLHRSDLLAIDPPQDRPTPYPQGRPFVLLGPGAIGRQAWVRAQLEAAGAARIGAATGHDYPRVAWHLYEMYGGRRPRDARDLLRFELDRHLWADQAARCCALYYDPPTGLDPVALKATLRRGIGRMRFYRLVVGELRDTSFTSFLHMPDPEDVDRECWHLRRLGMADPRDKP